MKNFLTAIALTIAIPAMAHAQPAPAAKADCCDKMKAVADCCKDMAKNQATPKGNAPAADATHSHQ